MNPDRSSNPRPMHVVMLVNNPCVNDSRVIKSAEALVDVGHTVTVVCRQFGDLPAREERNGVQYHRIEPVPLDWKRLRRRIKAALPGRAHTGPLGSPREPMHENAQPTPAPAAVTGNDHTYVKDTYTAGNNQESTVGAFETRSGEHPKTSAEEVARRTARKLPDPIQRRIETPLNGGTACLAIRVARKIVRSAKRAGKRILTAIYWFSEADEFGTAARGHIAELSPDAVHAHDLTTLPAGGRAAKNSGAWLVYDSHELEMHRNSSYPWFVRLRRRMLERKYIRRTDAVVTVSESIADHLRNEYRIPRPAVVMNAPLFDSNITPETTVRQDIDLGPDDKLCVYVGNATVNRGLDVVVRALATMPDLHFAIVGPRRPATEVELVNLASDLGVQDRLHLIDPVAPNEVVGYISTADVSVLPIQNVCLSYYYCMPNKLLESVFAGVPVAVANLLEMRRFVDANACGVVMDETDPKAIAQAVRQVITGHDQYVLSPERRATLAEQYGWSMQAIRLQSLYSAFGVTTDRKALGSGFR